MKPAGGNVRVNRLISVGTPLLLLAAWEIAAQTHAIDTRFFSSPSRIFAQFWQMLADGELLYHAVATVARVLIGFVIGTTIGVVLGLAIGLVPTVPPRCSLWSMRLFRFPKLRCCRWSSFFSGSARLQNTRSLQFRSFISLSSIPLQACARSIASILMSDETITPDG